MEAPVAFNADSVRDEKVKVLEALRPMNGGDAMLKRDFIPCQHYLYEDSVDDQSRIKGTW
jgi:glucose-6-phosphate 1-dehydrogenase